MAEVKWIHIATGVFDDEKIKIIEDMPDADSIIVIWFKLLCLAGVQNRDGTIMLNDRMPFTEKMLAAIFRRKEATVQLALRTFEEFGMIEVVDGVITIPNWQKHQNAEGLAKIREDTRRRVAAFRDRQKLECNANGNVTVTLRNATEEEEEKEEEGEAEKDGNKKSKISLSPEATDRASAGEIMVLYNEICTKLPKVKAMSDARRRAIKARQNQFTDDQIIEVFGKAQASSFMTGGNNRNWMASFDWIMNGTNFVKVLEGKYDDRPGQTAGGPRPKGADELDASYRMMAEWAREEA